ncbi:DUF6314 family protein [Roseivivax sp. CAU 1753]
MAIRLSTCPAPDLPFELFDFEGVWRFRRKITDRKLGQISQGRGTLRLTRDGDMLRYEEQVTLDMPGQPPIEGTRRYLWRACPRGIAVLFEDGRPFHVIGLPDRAPRDTHHCEPDIYTVSYDLGDWPLWSVTWEVSGPRKDYRMETLFVRDRSAEDA